MATSNRKRVLFIAEAVTLAHVARPSALANALDTDEFSVAFAAAPRYAEFLPAEKAELHPIQSISGDAFLAALEQGRPLYDLKTLRRYVEEDLRVLRRVRPSIVVGDFRLSLAVSARVERIPYVSLCNAYWSPYAHPRFELPPHPLDRIVGRQVASAVFGIARPFAFAYHALPMNRLRRQFGRGDWNLDLRRAYTEADYVAYADIPELIPTRQLPSRHSYIGPVLWSPPTPRPSWWDNVDPQSAIVYISLGSSGPPQLLPRILDALASLAVTAIVSTAGAPIPVTLPANVYCAPYLPGDLIVPRARLVICNGGSPATQQALVAGVPVLGIAHNMDQLLNMNFVQAYGAGLRLRSDEINPRKVRAKVEYMLRSEGFRAAAARLASQMRAYDAPARFARVLRECTPTK